MAVSVDPRRGQAPVGEDQLGAGAALEELDGDHGGPEVCVRRYPGERQERRPLDRQILAPVLVAFVFIALALAIVMALAAKLRRWWWLTAAPLFAGLALLSSFVSPFLIPRTHDLHNPALAADARVDLDGDARDASRAHPPGQAGRIEPRREHLLARDG